MKSFITALCMACLSSFWTLNAYADRLYSWVDEKGVVHISKKPPSRSAELIDIMDYKNSTVPPANQKQQKDLNLTDAGESKKDADKTGTDEDLEEDVVYDSPRVRDTGRERQQDTREQRYENRKGREKKGDSDPDQKNRYREDSQARKDRAKKDKTERQKYLEKRRENRSSGPK